MHEMGIALQVVEIVKKSIPKDMDGCKVEAVNLKVGKLSAVVCDSLRFCFDVVAKDTPLEGAKLNIEEIPVKANCIRCGITFEITGPAFTCPECQSGDIRMISGRELDIETIEISEPEV